MKGYGFEIPIQVRWRDLDAFAHVNNAVFATYLEIEATAEAHIMQTADHREAVASFKEKRPPRFVGS